MTPSVSNSVQRTVPLRELPSGVEFPTELRSRITYDAGKQQLVFDGSMSKQDFDCLLGLHNDIGYQQALQELFQKCTFPRSPAPSQRFSIALVQRASRWLRGS
jgi:hypothetical protein